MPKTLSDDAQRVHFERTRNPTLGQAQYQAGFGMDAALIRRKAFYDSPVWPRNAATPAQCPSGQSLRP